MKRAARKHAPTTRAASAMLSGLVPLLGALGLYGFIVAAEPEFKLVLPEWVSPDCGGQVLAEIMVCASSRTICTVRRNLKTGEIKITGPCDFTVEEYKAKWGKAQP